MVPGSFGCGSAVLAATTMLAPSRAARSAMARPMPREAPVTNRVLPERLIVWLLAELAEVGRAALGEGGEGLGRLRGAKAFGELDAFDVHHPAYRLGVAHQP